MKVIAIILLAILTQRGCEDSSQMKDTPIEYSAYSRGFYQKITVQDKKFSVSRDRNGNDKPQLQSIGDSDWKTLVSAFQKIKPENLPNLKPPTEKRFYDGAAIAKLTVTHNGATYETTDFDHGEPPAEISELVNRVLALVKEE